MVLNLYLREWYWYTYSESYSHYKCAGHHTAKSLVTNNVKTVRLDSIMEGAVWDEKQHQR